MKLNIEHLGESLFSGISYLPNTIRLVFIPLLIGLILGMAVALVRVYKVPVLGKFFALFVTVYQGIPIIVALMLYNLLFMLGFNDFAGMFHIKSTMADIDNIWVGIFALSMISICSVSEVLRGAFLSVPAGQAEAGYSVGLTTRQTLGRIIIPQMLPIALPMLVNSIVGLIKASSVVMAIGVAEIVAGSLIPGSRTYSFLEGYVAAALIYWTFTVLIESFASILIKKAGKYRRSSND